MSCERSLQESDAGKSLTVIYLVEVCCSEVSFGAIRIFCKVPLDGAIGCEHGCSEEHLTDQWWGHSLQISTDYSWTFLPWRLCLISLLQSLVFWASAILCKTLLTPPYSLCRNCPIPHSLEMAYKFPGESTFLLPEIRLEDDNLVTNWDEPCIVPLRPPIAVSSSRNQLLLLQMGVKIQG